MYDEDGVEVEELAVEEEHQLLGEEVEHRRRAHAGKRQVHESQRNHAQQAELAVDSLLTADLLCSLGFRLRRGILS